ncbi:MAG: tyrosine-type recombinase/integrase [Treponemataceae bacterium]|nr:tyrosine-type recombinase/integrase [Treponemataceae bacterium]
MQDGPLRAGELVSEFLVYLESVRGLSANSVAAYRNDLKHFLDVVGPETDVPAVSSAQLRACVAQLSLKNRASTSVNRFISAVRTFFAYCRKFGYIQYNPALELKTVRTPGYMPRFLTAPEIDNLCRQPERSELLWKVRDTAIFETMYSTGCRVGEIASLKTSDLSDGCRSAVVIGKGSKARKVYFGVDARAAVEEYLADRRKRFAGEGVADASPSLFVNQRGGALTAGGIRWILARYTGPDGTRKPVSPHALRHTFATSMLSAGADVRVVQELLGHSRISTTQRYTHITAERLIAIYNEAHPHGGGDDE